MLYTFPRILLLLLMLPFLVGCSIQWGSPPQPAPVVDVPAAAAPATPVAQSTTTVEATPLPEAEPSHWTVGLLDEPASVLPFSADGRVAAPISEAIFPSPILGLGWTYTTTGVLLEMPTLANGGVERRPAEGYLDATGQYTVTATDQPTTTEQLVVTFRWNPELHWADGTPVTADDSVFAWEEARRQPATPDVQALLEMVERYEVVDTHTTRALLTPGRIDPSYPLAAWPPLPRHLLADATDEAREQYDQSPLGYGPYTFAEAIQGESIVLSLNDYWPRREGMPEQLRFHFFPAADDLRTALLRGEIDVGVLERVPSDLYRFLDQDAASGAAAVTYVSGPISEHVDFNLSEPLLQDIRVRQAIAHAINRQALANDLFGGKPAVLHSWILPDQAAYAGDEQLTRYPYDRDRARRLLDQAGLADTNGDGLRELSNGGTISLTLHTTDTPLRVEFARRIEADLREVGLLVRGTPLPIDQLYSPTGPLFRREFQLAAYGWLGGVEPAGTPLWSCTAVPAAENGFTGNNFAGWCVEPAEAFLRTAATSPDPRVRAAAYLRHQQLWSAELPSLPLLQRPIVVLHDPRIHDIEPDALAPITWNVDAWRR
ncbi:MAG TPA: peptide ABC transporter substrate-binding protein [Herpetosiphonaceae bacterium]|nr:peptide ABC transporter substrate-binding protein [Herpetosiphonaceae bacterium]